MAPVNVLLTVFLLVLQVLRPTDGRGPRVAPYVDIMMSGPSLSELSSATGAKAFTVAFAVGGTSGCEPMWGGELPLNESKIINNIREFQSMGGQVIVATGGALGPYLESICTTEAALTGAYFKILDTVKTNHLDIDIEAAVPLNVLVKSLKNVQNARPETTVRLTLMVQGDDYGLTPELGVNLLKAAASVGLRVDIVNPMTMEFGTSRSDWGEAVISALESTLKQMASIWPEKSTSTLRSMLGATPMIGRNFNGKIFEVKHARSLVDYAKKTGLGYLGFWSVGRDNGKCPGGGISPSCSSIAQSEYEFTKLFNEYADFAGQPSNENGTSSNEIDDKVTNDKSTASPSTTTTSAPLIKTCKGHESRFDEWCVANCARDNCPESICTCSTSPLAPKLVYRTNRI